MNEHVVLAHTPEQSYKTCAVTDNITTSTTTTAAAIRPPVLVAAHKEVCLSRTTVMKQIAANDIVTVGFGSDAALT